MSREWKPGDVALVSGRVALVWDDEGSPRPTFVYTDAEGEPCSVWAEGINARPLVVIDAEDREQVGRLLSIIRPEAMGGVDILAAHLREFANPTPPKLAPIEDRPIVHAVMYRDYKIGSLCDSGAWGAATLFSMVTDDVTCPGCRNKLDGGPMGVTQ